jgi:hypothetical protein
MGERARAAIIDAVRLSLVPLYRIVGPTAVTILFLMFIWGVVKLVFTIIMSAIPIYWTRGAGLWILGAFWSLSFQLLITRSHGSAEPQRVSLTESGLRWSARHTTKT